MRILGFILIIIGIVMLFIPGIGFTTKETVIDAGPIELSAEKNHDVSWPVYAGGIVAGTGLALVFFAKKK
ncbi:MAG: hypothetical protein B7Z16_14680 [Algoriphagus sp. 32-45-6]|nr:MAG: hypothetical protein B7Z16_14680 [Algoriphagus sp. 32-45-6]